MGDGVGLRFNERLGQIVLVRVAALTVAGNGSMLTCGASVVASSTDTSASYTSSNAGVGSVSRVGAVRSGRVGVSKATCSAVSGNP